MDSPDLDLFAGWPLHRAAFAGDVESIERLVAFGYAPNTVDDGGTPLFLARCEAAVRALLRLSADPGFVSESGETVLMSVALIGSSDAVEALVTIGRLDPNDTDASGNTTLMEAARGRTRGQRGTTHPSARKPRRQDKLGPYGAGRRRPGRPCRGSGDPETPHQPPGAL